MAVEIHKRWQEKPIKEALKTRRVLILAGARQCGKTTLAKSLVVDNTIYRTLDDVTQLRVAQSDPHGFINHGDELMIIDEVQQAPQLLKAIKKDVDENQKPGRFLLTGSANIQSLPGVTESLAGRVKKIRLHPLAMGEVEKAPPRFIEKAFAGDLSHPDLHATEKGHSKDMCILQAIKGGFPEARQLGEGREMTAWYKDYLDAMLERDLKSIANIRRKDSMQKLLQVLAAWSSKYMDVASIGRSLSITRATVESYINALETLYLVERVKPWHKTDYDRIGKQDKIFMADTGLMSSVLRWRFDQVCLDGDLNGKLMETFVFNQLAAILDAQQGEYDLYHYRDREKREVDFIVENEDGDILGIEVKAGSSVDKSMFKHLVWFKENMARGHSFKGIILYTGEHVLPFGKNLWVVPISHLWSFKYNHTLVI